jgi:hypothetical protein
MASKPWDDPPHPKRGDKKADLTYAAVGRALTQWEYLETKLAELSAANGRAVTTLSITLPIAPTVQCWAAQHGLR